MALSVGQFHFQTDGFRENNDLQHNIYTLFGQSDLTEKLSIQAEYRHRKSDSGDRNLNFDLDDFRRDFRDDVEEDVYRVGGRFTPSPGQIGLVSAIYTDREDDEDTRDPDIGLQEDEVSSDVGQLEGQYLGVLGPLQLVGGAGWADSNERFRRSEGGEVTIEDRTEVTSGDVYLVGSLAPIPTLDLTARLGYANVDIEDKEDIEEDETGTHGMTPGIGVVWRPLDSVRLRAAGGRNIKRPFVANQTLKPTQLAGFNEQFDDLDATRADWLGLAVDVQASESLRVGAEVLLRRLSREVSDFVNDKNETQNDDRALAYLYWTATDRIAASLELIAEDFSAHKRDFPVTADDVRTLTTPLRLTYAAPTGWFVTSRTAFVAQDVDRPDGTNTRDLDSHGVLIDVAAGYRLPKRRGVVALQVTNLLDQDLFFQDEKFRSSRESVNPRFVPSRMFLATLTLNF